MLRKTWWIIGLALIIVGLAATPARADGIIIPDPLPCDPGRCPPPPPCPGDGPCPIPPAIAQLVVKYHLVDVQITDQVAVTHVDQVFYNPNDWPVEGTYLFPLPLDAAVTNFVLWVDGQPVEGKVLEAQEARRVYEDIVSSLRDPALLEYAGRGAVQARIFPIPARGERRVELEYTQALTADGGLVHYSYPLSTEKFSLWPLEKVSISVDIRSSVPVRAVYSPSHRVDVVHQGENQVSAGYEEANVLPDKDFNLYYSLGAEQAFHLLSFRDPAQAGEEDGFFLLMLAPSPGPAAAVPKDMLLVLDRSGSMEGEKFQQAQAALRYVLEHLNPEDRFNLVAFSTSVESYASGLRPASEAAEALGWVNGLSAVGSTDINRALLEAMSMVTPGVVSERPTYLIFLTDGLPTRGEIDSQRILENIRAAAPEQLRLFSFGVGYDVDTLLLDTLAQEHHGASSYVRPEERLDESLSVFYERISTPVLTDLKLDFGSMSVYDLYPSPLPDLFAGTQLILVGRYREGGAADIILTGNVNGEQSRFVYPKQVFAGDSHLGTDAAISSIPRLWATRKIGYLLNQVRLLGPDPETIDQIVRLSIRYGIVTPYTSYLVTEEMPLGAAEQQRISDEAYSNAQVTATAPASGQAAVEKAADQGALSAAEQPAAAPSSAAPQVRVVGERTYVFKDSVWVDTAYDPANGETVKVAFLSPDYFSMAEQSPTIAAGFALGERVIVMAGGVAYEVVVEGSATPPLPSRATTVPEIMPTVEQGVTPEATPGAESPNPPAASTGGCPGSLLPLALVVGGGIFAKMRGKMTTFVDS